MHTWDWTPPPTDAITDWLACDKARRAAANEGETLHWLSQPDWPTHKPTDALPPGPLSELICSWVGAHLEPRDCSP